MVYMDSAKSDGLVQMLLGACQAQKYQEHLGNSTHIALKVFWYLQGMIEDNNPETYNKCAKLLMSVEAQVVNQHFKMHRPSFSYLLHEIPGLKEKLFGASLPPTPVNVIGNNEDQDGLKKKKILDWVSAERQKRYKYFQAERDFIQALTNISETLRLTAVSERKALLPKELGKLDIPERAYIPLGKATDPFSQIMRVLEHEGTVFSTHSRAPCLICFEVVKEVPAVSLYSRLSNKFRSNSTSSVIEEDDEVATIIRRKSMQVDLEDVGSDEDVQNNSITSIESHTALSTPSTDEERVSLRRESVEQYSQGLSKMLHDLGAFGESWTAKKLRIQRSSPYGHLPGWNVVSLVRPSISSRQVLIIERVDFQKQR